MIYGQEYEMMLQHQSSKNAVSLTGLSPTASGAMFYNEKRGSKCQNKTYALSFTFSEMLIQSADVEESMQDIFVQGQIKWISRRLSVIIFLHGL